MYWIDLDKAQLDLKEEILDFLIKQLWSMLEPRVLQHVFYRSAHCSVLHLKDKECTQKVTRPTTNPILVGQNLPVCN